MELKGIDSKTVEKVSEEGYFTRERKKDKAGEEAFFKQGEKPEVGSALCSQQHSVASHEMLTFDVVEEEGCECTCQRSESCRQGLIVEY